MKLEIDIPSIIYNDAKENRGYISVGKMEIAWKAIADGKPLEQEPILDKVRIEIEQNAYPIVHGVNNHELGMTLYGILQVIDKYRAEIEPQESEVSDADNN